MFLVEALDTYEKKNIIDNRLGRVPKAGELFEVSKERLDVLLGNNAHNLVFVKLVEEPKNGLGNPVGTREVKKTVKKKKTK